MPAPLVGNSTCQMKLLPLNALNQIIPAFTPGVSDITLTDDQGATYTISSITWDPTSSVGTMVFTTPTVTGASVRTLTLSVDGTPIATNPTPIQVTILPAFGGHSALNNAWLAWDLQVPNATTTQIGDYSGGNNYAVNQAGGYFVVPRVISTTKLYSSPTQYTLLGRTALTTDTRGANENTVPILYPVPATFSGRPFGSISTVFYRPEDDIYSRGKLFPLWRYTYTDSNGVTRDFKLCITFYPSPMTLTLYSYYNGVWNSVLTYPTGTRLIGGESTTNYCLLTLLFNADSSASLYINGTLLGTASNVYGSTTPPNDASTNTLTYFAGMGDGNVYLGDTGYLITDAQLEMVCYTTILTAQQIALNAAAWGLS